MIGPLSSDTGEGITAWKGATKSSEAKAGTIREPDKSI